MQEENHARVEQERQKQEQRLRERNRRQREIAEERRLRELKKKASAIERPLSGLLMNREQACSTRTEEASRGPRALGLSHGPRLPPGHLSKLPCQDESLRSSVMVHASQLQRRQTRTYRPTEPAIALGRAETGRGRGTGRPQTDRQRAHRPAHRSVGIRRALVRPRVSETGWERSSARAPLPSPFPRPGLPSSYSSLMISSPMPSQTVAPRDPSCDRIGGRHWKRLRKSGGRRWLRPPTGGTSSWPTSASGRSGWREKTRGTGKRSARAGPRNTGYRSAGVVIPSSSPRGRRRVARPLCRRPSPRSDLAPLSPEDARPVAPRAKSGRSRPKSPSRWLDPWPVSPNRVNPG